MKKFILSILTVMLFSLQQTTPSFAGKTPVFDINEKVNFINPDFWQRFEDEYLTCYILQAVKNNHEAKSAVYKSEQFRQEVKYSFGNELPSLNVAANYLGIKVPLLDNFRLKKNSFILPFQFNYEADLFAKNRDKTKSALRLYKAQKYDEKTAYIMLASDVGTTYVNILKFDKTIELQKAYLDNQNEIIKRQREKYKYGVISKTELNDEEKKLTDTRAQLDELIKNRNILLNQLALLIGQSADCACDLARLDFDAFATNLSLPDEICSDLIFDRPDVLSAQSKLASARIDVRVAKKEFFPTFNITGMYVFNTLGPGNFFSWRSTFAALVAGASQDIFTGGKKIANLRMKKARYDELFENYMHSNLNAIKEVNDALVQVKYNKNILNEAALKYKKEENNYQMQENRFKKGTVSYLSVLEEANDLIIARQNYVEKKTAKFVDAISLYKSTGGAL